MTGAQVRTVDGDVPADQLGWVDSHDHLFLVTPQLPGQQLDDLPAAHRELAAFASAGGGTLVQWTPAGLGRRLEDLVRLARTTGVRIVAATGRHRGLHYGPDTLLELSEDELARVFIDDVTAHGCGLIKVGTGYHALDRHEKVSLHAAAAAHHATGAPIAIHLERGTAGDLVLAELAAVGVRAESVVLGHVNRCPDPYYVSELADTGAYLALDGPSSGNHATDVQLTSLLASLQASGRTANLLIGGDTTTASARGVDGGPGLAGLRTRTDAFLRRHLGDDLVESMTVRNPARAWRLRRA